MCVRAWVRVRARLAAILSAGALFVFVVFLCDSAGIVSVMLCNGFKLLCSRYVCAVVGIRGA